MYGIRDDPGHLRSPRVVEINRPSPGFLPRQGGNLLAAYLERKYSVRGIYIFRHPCAVIASLRRGRANLEVYSSESFLKILMDQRNLVNDHLGLHQEHIRRWKDSPTHRLALAHAITNLVPQEQMANGLYHPHFVRYEELTLHPGKVLQGISAYLNQEPGGREPDTDPDEEKYVSRDSLTTKTSREKTAPEKRCFGWKDELARAEIDDVYAICQGFGPPLSTRLEEIDRLETPHPKPLDTERDQDTSAPPR